MATKKAAKTEPKATEPAAPRPEDQPPFAPNRAPIEPEDLEGNDE